MRVSKTIQRLLVVMFVLPGWPDSGRSQTQACFEELDPDRGQIGMRFMRHDVKLDGVAKGGELVLMEIFNPNPRYIRIDTQAGEPAEVVIARMAAAINEVSPFNPDRGRMRIPNERGELVSGDSVPIVRAEDNWLKSFGCAPGDYIFAGTETGLGLPPPPTSLSVSYEAESQEVSLHWENPSPSYDAVKTNHGGTLSGTSVVASAKRPPSEKRAIPPKLIAPGRLRDNRGLRRFHVIGCRNGVLSNAGVITLNYEDNSQEELDTHPFTGGIAPNWISWSSDNAQGAVVLEQGTKGEWKRFEQNPQAPLEPDDKPFYQLIKTRSPDAVGGLSRKFLSLQPGHTYRLWVRMNTFQMDQAEGGWSFSFHAVPHSKSLTLTPAQMAGSAELPNGTSGITAGQVAAYGPGSTTGGKFVERSTEKLEMDSHVLDITMPPEAEVITVWFRYTGPALSTGVGFDWIKLKDITAAQ